MTTNLTGLIMKTILDYERVMRLSDVVRIQREYSFECASANVNGVFPDENRPEWKAPDDLGDYLIEEQDRIYREHISMCEDKYQIATHRFPLDSLILDVFPVHLRLTPESMGSEEGQYYAKGWEPPYEGAPPSFVLLGEISGHEGHVTVCRDDGKMFTVAHAFNFYVTPPSED